MTDIHYLVWSTILTFVMVIVASVIRGRSWEKGRELSGFGNRDDLPPPTPLADRSERAANNMKENMIFFLGALLAARLAGAAPDRLALYCAIFFWARVVYFPLYLAGIKYFRSAVWAVGAYGIARLLIAAL